MDWFQLEIQLSPKRRGCHLITEELLKSLPQLRTFQVGLAHFFLQHTSASLTINENADPDVRTDMESSLNRIVPESQPFIHTIEGVDDMPAHVKSALLGAELTIPIRNGKLWLGTWQGIYLCEHRNQGGPRTIAVTIHGSTEESKKP